MHHYHAFISIQDPKTWQQHLDHLRHNIAQDEQTAYFIFDDQGATVAHRAHICAQSRDALVEQLATLTLPNATTLKQYNIAFLCTGQGAQYPHMAAMMRQYAPFSCALEEAFAALNPHLPQTLESVIYPADETTPLLVHQTHYTQPALFAIEYAFARTWQAFGISPSACMGHSIGEFAAAVIAGVMSLEEGARLICKRSELMQSLPSKGGMAALMLGHEPQIDQWLQKAHDQGMALDVAAFNGPKQTVLSGDSAAIEAVVGWAKEARVRATPITVSHAFHSSHMEPILDAFETEARSIAFNAPTHCQLVSNLHGNLMDAAPTARYWREHIRDSVRYHQGIEALFAQDVDAFIEVGPHPTLIGMSKRCYQGDTPPMWLPSIQNKTHDFDSFFDSLATLFIAGQTMHLPA